MEQNYTADSRLDELSELQEMALERGFESIEDMQGYDREIDLRFRDREAA